MRMNQKEWYDRCMRGTSGEMVFDILQDWKETITRIIERLEALRDKGASLLDERNETLDLAIRIVKEEMEVEK